MSRHQQTLASVTVVAALFGLFLTDTFLTGSAHTAGIALCLELMFFGVGFDRIRPFAQRIANWRQSGEAARQAIQVKHSLN